MFYDNDYRPEIFASSEAYVSDGRHPDLVFPDPPSVAGSPTSQAAAQSIKKQAAQQRDLVLAALTKSGNEGLTDEEGTKLTGLNPSSYRPRRRELQLMGLLLTWGLRKTESGRLAQVWRVK